MRSTPRAPRRTLIGSFATIALAPDWHHTLDGQKNGTASWGLEYDDGPPGTWAANHVTVLTTAGPKVVQGEVKRGTAPFASTIFVTLADGSQVAVKVDSKNVEYISFIDEHGQSVRAYSLDGKTWVRSEGGTIPVIQFNGAVTQSRDQDGTIHLYSAGTEIGASGPGGANLTINPTWFNDPTNQGLFGWYDSPDGQGAPGQVMSRSELSPDGVLNMLPVYQPRVEYGSYLPGHEGRPTMANPARDYASSLPGHSAVSAAAGMPNPARDYAASLPGHSAVSAAAGMATTDYAAGLAGHTAISAASLMLHPAVDYAAGLPGHSAAWAAQMPSNVPPMIAGVGLGPVIGPPAKAAPLPPVPARDYAAGLPGHTAVVPPKPKPKPVLKGKTINAPKKPAPTPKPARDYAGGLPGHTPISVPKPPPSRAV